MLRAAVPAASAAAGYFLSFGVFGTALCAGNKWDAFDKCADPACHSKDDLRKLFSGAGGRASRSTGAGAPAGGKSASKTASSGENGKKKVWPSALSTVKSGCPLDRDQLGAATWGLLHTTAAYFPEKPTPEEQKAAKDLVSGLAALYPCPHCAEDFRESVTAAPVDTTSRKTFSLWVCEQHNAVNRKLGKPAVPCSIDALDRVWRTGSEGCWDDDDDRDEAEDAIPQ